MKPKAAYVCRVRTGPSSRVQSVRHAPPNWMNLCQRQKNSSPLSRSAVRRIHQTPSPPTRPPEKCLTNPLKMVFCGKSSTKIKFNYILPSHSAKRWGGQSHLTQNATESTVSVRKSAFSRTQCGVFFPVSFIFSGLKQNLQVRNQNGCLPDEFSGRTSTISCGVLRVQDGTREFKAPAISGKDASTKSYRFLKER